MGGEFAADEVGCLKGRPTITYSPPLSWPSPSPATWDPLPSEPLQVVEGLDYIKSLDALPVVQDNSSSPFFQAGKNAGDKRSLS